MREMKGRLVPVRCTNSLSSCPGAAGLALLVSGRSEMSTAFTTQYHFQVPPLCSFPFRTRCSTSYIAYCMCAQSCPTLRNPMDCSLPGSSVRGKNPGVGCHALLQGIFPTRGSNLRVLWRLHWRVGSLPTEPSAQRNLFAKQK